MKNEKYLKKRHNTWWFQRRVPKNLQHLFDREIHSESLQTDSLALALCRRNEILADWSALATSGNPATRFESHLRLLKQKQLNSPDSRDTAPSGFAGFREQAYAALTTIQERLGDLGDNTDEALKKAQIDPAELTFPPSR